MNYDIKWLKKEIKELDKKARELEAIYDELIPDSFYREELKEKIIAPLYLAKLAELIADYFGIEKKVELVRK